MAETPGNASFQLFTSLRYDPILLHSKENSTEMVSFTIPSPFYMLVYHRDRMLEAARHFEWNPVIQKLQDGKALEAALLAEVENRQRAKGGERTPLRIRILFSTHGDLKVETFDVPPVHPSVLYPPSLTIPSPPNPSSSPSQNSSAFRPSPLTGGALTLGPTDSLPAAASTSPSSLDHKEYWQLHLDTVPTPSTAHTSLKTTLREHYDASRARHIPKDASNPSKHEVLLHNTCDEMTEGTVTSIYFLRGGQWVTPPVGSQPSKISKPGGSADTTYVESEVVAVEKKMGANEHPTGEKQPDVDDGKNDEGDRLPSFAGRWGHSLRSATSWPDSGGQRGTTRRWALRSGHCMEEIVDRSSVKVGELVWVSNGVRGFHIGKIVD